MRRYLEMPYRFCCVAGIALVTGMTIVVCLNIVSRYFFGYSFSWSEEVARYMMVWATMIGAAMAIRKWSHFRLEFLEHHVSARLRSIMHAFALLCSFLVGCLLVYQGIIWLPLTSHQLATATQVPMSYIYLSLPLCGILIVLFGGEALYDTWKKIL
jgi:TRAP-type transport system small permease protein